MQQVSEPNLLETKHHRKIGLLGASFDTGNMGVGALAEATVKIILNHWPDAEIILLGSGDKPSVQRLYISEREINIKTIPIRFSMNIFLPHHFLGYVLYGLLARVLPQSRAKDALLNRNPHFRTLYETELVADITAGDSFSDIYGMRRFILGFLRKWLVLLFNKELIMLPQTYGPLDRPLAKAMARHILNRTSKIYSRDKASVEYVKVLLGKNQNGKVRFAPDIAFVLDARKPSHINIEPSTDIRARDSIVVGLNISGLLFNGGYNRNNMFGLSCDYRELIISIMEMLLQDQKVSIMLIPHVFPPAGNVVESDPDACLKIYEKLRGIYPGKIFIVKGEYDQGEIKYIIGLCDFFLGSRMHACIAAMSQNIPTVGIAYSKKFQGVFESVNLGNCVVDVRSCDEQKVLEKIDSVLKHRNKIRNQLEQVMPQVKENVLGIFSNYNGREGSNGI